MSQVSALLARVQGYGQTAWDSDLGKSVRNVASKVVAAVQQLLKMLRDFVRPYYESLRDRYYVKPQPPAVTVQPPAQQPPQPSPGATSLPPTLPMARTPAQEPLSPASAGSSASRVWGFPWPNVWPFGSSRKAE